MELLTQEPTAPISAATELHAKAMLFVARRGCAIWDEYLQSLPADMPGKRAFIEAIAPAVIGLTNAAEALASAVDEASCEEGCACLNHPYHRALKAGE